MRRLLVCVAALAACHSPAQTAAPAASATSAPTTAVPPPNAVYVRDVDGDTIDVTIDGQPERVRLIGIDTPETKKPNTPVQCFGREASAYTAGLLSAGDPVYLERDVVARDDYGRLLAYVYRGGDGLFVNLDVIAAGYARPLTIPPNVAHADQFVEAARAAERGNLGLWSSCSG